MNQKAATRKKSRGFRLRHNWRQYRSYYIMFLPCVILLGIFCYYPMYGIVLTIKDFYPQLGILQSPFADPIYQNFLETFQDPEFLKVTLNTLRISFLRLLVGFPTPIILALLFNEVRHSGYKRSLQSIMYLPNFLSWVVLGGMFKVLLSGDGLVNEWLGVLGISPIPFLTDGTTFIGTLLITEIWKSAGYGSIIYLAAISGIDQEQYEAATIDGATRWQAMRYITLPGMSVAISISLILALSSVLDGGFDQIFNMYSVAVYDTADIIDTFVYRTGVVAGGVELATTVGLMKSVIGFTLILLSNKAIKRLGGEGVW